MIDGPRVTTVEEAASYVAELHCVLLFPIERIALPSLWEAIAGPDVEAFAAWGENEDRVWGWKDELPARGLAWYGKLVGKRATLLSPALVAELYPGSGRDDDYLALPLSAEAARVAAALGGGPLPQSVLREDVGLAGKAGKARFDRAMRELEGQLLVTHAGVWEQDSGWPAAVIDLTPRRFDVGGRRDPVAAAAKYLDAALEGTARDVARAFGWPAAEARTALDTLVARGGATPSARGVWRIAQAARWGRSLRSAPWRPTTTAQRGAGRSSPPP